jgi:hypothetical protein
MRVCARTIALRAERFALVRSGGASHRELRRPDERPGQLRQVRQCLYRRLGMPRRRVRVPRRRDALRQRREPDLRRLVERSRPLRRVRYDVRHGRKLPRRRMRLSVRTANVR